MVEQDHIDHVLDHYDFDRVASAMDCLGWRWRGATVDVPMLRREARRLLREACRIKGRTGSGGLVAEYYQHADGDYLSLDFVVESWDSSDLADAAE